MIGCLRTCVRKQAIIALNFEFENELKFYNLWAWRKCFSFRILDGKEMRIECKFLPRQGNGILFEDEVSFTAMSLNPDFANETITGRLQTLNSYDPAARLLTLIGCCEVMLTSLIGVKQSLETIDIIFFIASHVEAAEELNKQHK